MPHEMQVSVDVDTEQYANAEQSRRYGHATAFFGASYQQVAMTTRPSFWHQGPAVREEVVESLERSLEEHKDVWADLARR
jgi:hypothetical protein